MFLAQTQQDMLLLGSSMAQGALARIQQDVLSRTKIYTGQTCDEKPGAAFGEKKPSAYLEDHYKVFKSDMTMRQRLVLLHVLHAASNVRLKFRIYHGKLYCWVLPLLTKDVGALGRWLFYVATDSVWRYHYPEWTVDRFMHSETIPTDMYVLMYDWLRDHGWVCESDTIMMSQSMVAGHVRVHLSPTSTEGAGALVPASLDHSAEGCTLRQAREHMGGVEGEVGVWTDSDDELPVLGGENESSVPPTIPLLSSTPTAEEMMAAMDATSGEDQLVKTIGGNPVSSDDQLDYVMASSSDGGGYGSGDDSEIRRRRTYQMMMMKRMLQLSCMRRA